MASYHINGGKELRGTVNISGSKNAALPIICATLLTTNKCLLRNIPDIKDVRTLLQILAGLGSKFVFKNNTLEIDNSGVAPNRGIANTHKGSDSNQYIEPDADLVRKLRGSILLLGPLLARFGNVRMPCPGGDLIGRRPIDAHLMAFTDLGAQVLSIEKHDLNRERHNLERRYGSVEQKDYTDKHSKSKHGEYYVTGRHNEYIEMTASGTNSSTEEPRRFLTDANIILQELSVTATENAIMAAALASGRTEIHLAAAEPHVQDLCRFLRAMGVSIFGIGTHDLVIEGLEQDQPHGTEYRIIFDNEVAVSFMIMAAVTRSELEILNIQAEYLRAPLILMRQMGVNFEVLANSVKIKKPAPEPGRDVWYRHENSKEHSQEHGPEFSHEHTPDAANYFAARIKPNIYPGLLTDYVPPFAVLATQAKGASLIHEWMFDGRLGYIHELAKMGADTRILDPHRAEIIGPRNLRGANISSLDIRGGMVLLIAALAASGQSILHDIEHIQRGYENIDMVLRGLGADIEVAAAD